ncbi:MAG: hypothetical protein ACMG55_05520, partial [Microcoleus sp.]
VRTLVRIQERTKVLTTNLSRTRHYRVPTFHDLYKYKIWGRDKSKFWARVPALFHFVFNTNS